MTRRPGPPTPGPPPEMEAWLAPLRRFWSTFVDALERHLDRRIECTAPSPQTENTRRS